MGSRGNSQNNIKIIAATIFVLLLAGVLFFFRFDNRATVTEYNVEVLMELTKQKKSSIEQLFPSYLGSIEIIADTYGNRFLNPDTLDEALKSAEEKGVFDYVRYIDDKGMNHTSDGTISDCSDRDYYIKGIYGNKGICYVNESRLNKESMVGFYCPIRENGYIAGIALGFISQSSLHQLLSNSFYGYDLRSYLIDPTGTIVASSEMEKVRADIFLFIDTAQLASFRVLFQSKAFKESGKSALVNGESSSAITDLIFCTGMEDTDLVLVQVFPKGVQEFVLNHLSKSSSRLFLYSLIVFCLYLLFLVLFYNVSNTKNTRLQKLVFSSISQDRDCIFAYSEKTGKLILLKNSNLVTMDMETMKNGINSAQFLQTVVNKYVAEKEKKRFLEQCHLGLDLKDRNMDDVYLQTVTLIVQNKAEVMNLSYIPVWLENERFVVIAATIVTDVIAKELEEKTALANALVNAEEANIAKSRFLANMSHDIRTPMNAIIGFTNLALHHMDDKNALKNDLEKISLSSNHLLSLINDVLDMTKIEGGKIRLEERPCTLAEIFNNLTSINQTELARKSIMYHAYAEELVHETVFCDKLRLNQILLNCLSNAIKYTPEGGDVSLSVKELEVTGDYGLYEFRIFDTGIGMSEEFLKHIFEPFERERNSTVSGIQGTGLGMAITKNLVDLMHGEIEVQSKEGGGTKFFIRIPFRFVVDGNEKNLDYFQNKKTLVIGSTEACRTASSNFYRMGLDVHRAYTDEEAFSKAQGTSVFFIDKDVTDLYGFDFVTRVKTASAEKDVVVILAAYEFTEDVKSVATACGVTHYAWKPIFSSDLERILLSFLDKDETDMESTMVNLKGRKVLLVEDNALNRDIAEFILTDAGLSVEMVEDGKQAVERMEEVDADTYDIILMDIQMPVMNGYEATKAIRALPDKAKASIPIVAMTANAFEEDKRQSRASGMDAHVAKPIDVNVLFSTLSEIFQSKAYLGKKRK